MKLINKDKLLHFTAGALLTVAVVMVLGLIGATLASATSLAVTLVFVIAFMKEAYDQAHPEEHTAETLDAMVTLCGSATAVLVLRLLEVTGVL